MMPAPDRDFIFRLVKLFAVVFLVTVLAIIAAAGVLHVVATVQEQRDPGIKVDSLAVDQVNVSPTHQLAIRFALSVRKGCVGTVARGFIRPTPGVPNSMDVQLLNGSPMPIGFTLADLGVGQPSISTSSGSTADEHRLITLREFIPSPTNLEPGGGWRFAEFLSQEGCGWLHGLLPINTSAVLGPPLVIAEGK